MADTNINYSITQTGGANVEQAFNRVEKEIVRTEAATKMLTKTQGSYNAVGINTARLFGDMGYGAQSFNMLIMSVGNNISPFAESLQRSKAEMGSWSAVAKSAFAGFGGYLVGLNLVLSAITAISIATRGAQKANEEWNLTTLIGNMNAYAEALGKVKKQLSELSDVDLGKTIGELNKKVSEKLRDQLNAMKAQAVAAPSGGLGLTIWQMIYGKPEDYTDAIKKLNDSIAAADAELTKRISNPGSLNFLREQLKKLVEDFDQGNTALAPQINRLKSQIKSIEDLINPNSKENKSLIENVNAIKEKIRLLEKERDTKSNLTAYDRVLYNQEITELKERLKQGEAFVKLMNTPIKINVFEPKLKDMIPKKLLNTNELYMQDYAKANNNQKTTDQLQLELYNRATAEFLHLGSSLRTIFRDAGNSFVSKLFDALSIAIQISEVIKSISSIVSFLETASTIGKIAATVATAGTGAVVGVGSSILGGGGSPTKHIVDIKFEGVTRAQVVATGFKQAIDLRYLN